jgi:hypothetical protein
VARALGLTHRTMNRRWAALVVRLRQAWPPAAGSAGDAEPAPLERRSRNV